MASRVFVSWNPGTYALTHHSLRFQERLEPACSFDASLAQDAVAEPPCILLRVNRHPHFLAGRWVLQQQMAAFS